MRLHESHEEGGFGVSHNTITRHAASYTTNARFVAFLGTFARPAQQVWLPGNDIQDPTTWDAPPLCTLKHLLVDLVQKTAPSKPHPNPRRRPLVAAQPPTRAHIRSLPQAPRTTATASSSYRSSTAFIWHSSGGRCPHQRPPALKTSRPSKDFDHACSSARA